MESFMVVKSFTLLNYFTNGEKEIEKEDFTSASSAEEASWLCVYLLVFLFMSLYVEGTQELARSVCVWARPRPVTPPFIAWLASFCTVKATGKTQENSEELDKNLWEKEGWF